MQIRGSMRAAPTFMSLLFLLAAVPAAAQEAPDSTALPDGLRAARTELSGAFTKLDAAGAAALFADDGAVVFMDQVIAGPDAVSVWFSDMFSTFDSIRATDATFDIQENEVLEKGGYMIRGPEGQQSGRTETTWKKQTDGTWKVARLLVL